jgi:hypothetical protein
MATQKTKNIDGYKVTSRESFVSVQSGQQTINGSLTVNGATNFNSASKVTVLSGSDVPVVNLVGSGSGGIKLSSTGSGGIVVIGDHAAAGRTRIFLPTPAAGLNYRFFASGSAAASGDMKVTSTSDGSTVTNLIYGNLSSSAGTAANAAGHAGNNASYSIWFGKGSNNWTPGDHAYLVSDGTYWYASGRAKVVGSLALDSASNAYNPVGAG